MKRITARILTTLLFTLAVITVNAQDMLSVIKATCICNPIDYTKKVTNHKLVYITEKSEREYFTREDGETSSYDVTAIAVNVIEKIGNQWVELNGNVIDNSDWDYLSVEDKFNYNQIVKINNQTYFYSIINAGNNGTAYNGTFYTYFIFYNLDTDEKSIVLSYSRSSGDFIGSYSVKSVNKNKSLENLADYKSFLKITNHYIDFIFGPTIDDLNHRSNYQIKWEVLNQDIYEKGKGAIDYDIHFVEFDSDGTDIVNIDEPFENEQYKAASGFSAPVVVYDKIRKKEMIVFIPQAMGAGAGWGGRSFYIKSLQGDILTIESSDDGVVHIMLKDRKIRWVAPVNDYDEKYYEKSDDQEIEKIEPTEESREELKENTLKEKHFIWLYVLVGLVFFVLGNIFTSKSK